MEKITILCGMEDQQKAVEFMRGVAAEMQLRGCRIESINYDNLVIFTKYTQICFFYSKIAQSLNGVKADAIFGFEPYKQRLAVYLKELAPYNVGKGMVDYICECEKNGPTAEAKATYEAVNDKFEDAICNHIHNTVREAMFKEHNVASIYPKDTKFGRVSDNEKISFMKEWERLVHKEAFVSYSKSDCDITYELYKKHMNNTTSTLPEIKDVIFNNPATIVFWADGTKTVVKADNEPYDPEKGLAMAIAKKVMGNKREYYHTFLHWLKKV